MFLMIGMAMVISFGYVCETWAGCNDDQMVCGDNCCATLNANGVLTISGFGMMYDYQYKCTIPRDGAECDKKGNPPPWEKYYDDIRTLQFATDSNITSIGAKAFIGASNLTSVRFPDSLKEIGYKSFKYNSLNSIILPDTVTSIGKESFLGNTNVPQTFEIICKGDIAKCQSLVKEYKIANGTIDLSANVVPADKTNCTGGKYFWNGIRCSKKEAYCDNDMYYTGSECIMRPTDGTDITCDYDISGYVKVGDYCASPENSYAKKHYTPAEANEWLHDGNDNFVVITFKK